MALHPARIRAHAWALAAAIVLIPSCRGRVLESVSSNQTAEGSGASASSGSGTAPSSNARGSSSSSGGSPVVVDASLPLTGDDESPPPSSDDTGPTSADDVSPPLSPFLAQACWDSKLPPEVQPILPTASVSASCAAAPMIAQWNTPIADAGGMDDTDARAAIVGRWVACTPGDGAFSSTPHAGVEFGANGRWRLLVTDSSGALVPTSSTGSDAQGHYYALAMGQIDIRYDGLTKLWIGVIALSPDGNAFELNANSPSGPAGPFYARTSPSPRNGGDNPPSTTDGTCSMVGSWDLIMSDASPSTGTFSFDASGNFVGGPSGSDLCASFTMHGTYQLTAGGFVITENIGMGVCHWWFDAGYMATFDKYCTRLTLTPQYDDCTGGRGYFNYSTTLAKRPD